MKYVKSCGFIVYKEIDNKSYYLIIKAPNGDIGFPKGHVENFETEIQTAIRELKEETNVEVEVINGFRHQIEYVIPKMIDTVKQTVYFLGKCIKDDIICQEVEVVEARFLPYEEAFEALTFVETKNILMNAEKYINERE